MRQVAFCLVVFLASILEGCAGTSPVRPQINASPAASLGRPASDPMFQFIGTWEGPIEGFDAPRFVDGAGHSPIFRFVITTTGVAVFTFARGTWNEIKAGLFRIHSWGSQALVYSITSGRDAQGTWIESSSFILMHDTPTTLIAYWVRAVNNLDLPVDHPDHHWTRGGSGQLRRMPGANSGQSPP